MNRKINIDDELVEFINEGIRTYRRRAGEPGPEFYLAALYALTDIPTHRQWAMCGIGDHGLLLLTRATPAFEKLSRQLALKFGATVLRKVVISCTREFAAIRGTEGSDGKCLLRATTKYRSLLIGKKCRLSELGFIGLMDTAVRFLERSLPDEVALEAACTNELIARCYVEPLNACARDIPEVVSNNSIALGNMVFKTDRYGCGPDDGAKTRGH